MKVSVTVEQKVVNGVAYGKMYKINIDPNRPADDGIRETYTHYFTAHEVQELAEKLQAEVKKALAI